jgi:hypothetical protein
LDPELEFTPLEPELLAPELLFLVPPDDDDDDESVLPLLAAEQAARTVQARNIQVGSRTWLFV